MFSVESTSYSCIINQRSLYVLQSSCRINMQSMLELGDLGHAPREILKTAYFEIDSDGIFNYYYKKQLGKFLLEF